MRSVATLAPPGDAPAAVPPGRPGSSRVPAPTLVDACLPEYDARIVRSRVVDATPSLTWRAIHEANLLDPLVRGLFRLREAWPRFAAWVRAEPWPGVPASMTFDDLLGHEPRPALLAEEPGVEVVVGSVGRFWRKDYGARAVTAAEFLTFHEPGWARLAMGFRVEPLGDGRTRLRYEARTATTDETSRRAFRRYWRVIGPGVSLVMGRALAHIAREAEGG